MNTLDKMKFHKSNSIKRNITIYTLTAMAVVNCTNGSDTDPNIAINAVCFNSNFATKITSTNDNCTWIKGDKIGITTVGYDTEYNNVAYYANSSAFETDFHSAPGEDVICHPNASKEDNKSVIFYAYYPYGEVENSLRTIDISAQKSDGLCSIDLLAAISKPIHYYVGAIYDNVIFTFVHSLSLITIDVTCNDKIPSLEGLTVRLRNMPTKGDYRISTSEIGTRSGDLSAEATVDLIVIPTPNDNKSATVVAILHPNNYTTPTICFEVNGKNYTTILNTELYPNKSHKFNTILGDTYKGLEIGATAEKWTTSNPDLTLYPLPK